MYSSNSHSTASALLERVLEFDIFPLIQTTTTYCVTVNYGHSLTEMIKAGKYGWVDNDITQENFPHDQYRGVEKVHIRLVSLKEMIENENSESRDIRPATLEELCAFGASFPQIQDKFPTFALGAPWSIPDANRHAPYLFTEDHERYLCLFCRNAGWQEFCRFAYVYDG